MSRVGHIVPGVVDLHGLFSRVGASHRVYLIASFPLLSKETCFDYDYMYMYMHYNLYGNTIFRGLLLVSQKLFVDNACLLIVHTIKWRLMKYTYSWSHGHIS